MNKTTLTITMRRLRKEERESQEARTVLIRTVLVETFRTVDRYCRFILYERNDIYHHTSIDHLNSVCKDQDSLLRCSGSIG